MRQRGMVLMTVLWIVLVVAFISFALAAAVRTELAAAGNSFDSERAMFMAKSAAEVIFRRLQNPGTVSEAPIREQDGAYVFRFDSGESQVRLESDGGLIDLNAASDKVLASIFDSLGLNERSRNELVDCILDWRDSDDVPHLYGAEVDDYGQVFLSQGRRLPYNAPFSNMEELLLVKHMTPEIYFGHVEFDPATGAYRKIPGLREIGTVTTGSSTVDVNAASIDVLAALPGIRRDVAADIVTERKLKHFGDVQDLTDRVTALSNSETLQYLTTAVIRSSMVVSTATVQPSGTSRTVRLHFNRGLQRKVLSYSPYIFSDIQVLNFDRWDY
ncbi:MAG TPA: hypothetical protein VER98_14195 [Terriglobia bacterium]|nr:hypothetical protein [Terriglobia bacterium]